MEKENSDPDDYVLLKVWNQRGERLKLYGRGETWKEHYSMGSREVYRVADYCYRLEFKAPRTLVGDSDLQAVQVDVTETEALAWLEQPLRGWREFKKGCWLAAGATAFFAVMVPSALAFLSLVMGLSMAGILESLFG